MSAGEQVSKFNELFNNSRFSATFQFYAAITKLQTPGIKDIVIRVAKKRNKTLTLSLLHCLYEAQDPSLYEAVAQQCQQKLGLSDTTLTPSDCLCVGYFLSHICNMATDKFRISLSACSINNQGCKYLVSGLWKGLDTRSAVTTPLTMDLKCNEITSDGVRYLSSLLEVDCIEDFILGGGYYTHNKLGSLQGIIILSALQCMHACC